MREILFRGKRLDDGEWVYGFITVNDSENPDLVIDYLIPSMSCYGQTEIDPETVGQYTGLTDKNDKRIFEGDVLLVVSRYIDEEDGNAAVVWDENTARFIIEWQGLVSDFDNFYGNECEVIGNIHDNPELLKGE